MQMRSNYAYASDCMYKSCASDTEDRSSSRISEVYAENGQEGDHQRQPSRANGLGSAVHVLVLHGLYYAASNTE